MSYSPSTAVLALYSQMDANMSGLTPPNTVLHTGPGRDPVTGTYLHIDAMMDAFFGCIGFQGQNDQAGGSYSNATTTFTNIYSAWTTSVNLPASVSKTFLLVCNVSCFIAVANDLAIYQLLVDGAAPAGQPTHSMQLFLNTVSEHMGFNFSVPIVLAGGSHTFQLQGKTDGAGGTMSTSATDHCLMTLVG